jgi:hypothetical protein
MVFVQKNFFLVVGWWLLRHSLELLFSRWKYLWFGVCWLHCIYSKIHNTLSHSELLASPRVKSFFLFQCAWTSESNLKRWATNRNCRNSDVDKYFIQDNYLASFCQLEVCYGRVFLVFDQNLDFQDIPNRLIVFLNIETFASVCTFVGIIAAIISCPYFSNKRRNRVCGLLSVLLSTRETYTLERIKSCFNVV